MLRRIMRRAMRHAHILGAKEPLLYRLVPTLVDQMGRAYHELERGMSLIEILIALTILALAVLGLMPLFVGSVKTGASASQLSNATALDRNYVRALLSNAYLAGIDERARESQQASDVNRVRRWINRQAAASIDISEPKERVARRAKRTRAGVHLCRSTWELEATGGETPSQAIRHGAIIGEGAAEHVKDQVVKLQRCAHGYGNVAVHP